jgi:excisionase family DNA binding protein
LRVEAHNLDSAPKSDDALEALERILEATPAEAIPALIAALSARLAAAAAEGLRPQAGRELSPEPDKNLSIEEAARRLGISKDFLYRTKLPFKVRIGRRVLFSARGLERWNQNRQGR